jgi:hypothetical protein
MKIPKEDGLKLFFDRRIDQEVDIDVLLRNDLSSFAVMRPGSVNVSEKDSRILDGGL